MPSPRLLPNSRFREPLAAALRVELHRFDRTVARLWQIVATVGMLAGVIYAITPIATSLALASSAVAAVYLAWFSILGHLLNRGPASTLLRTTTVFIEATIPWAYTIVLIVTQGAEYALGSWVPPMLFCALIVAHTARLRWRSSAAVGLVGGAIWPFLYLMFMRERLDELATHHVLYQPAMQLTRSGALVITGFIGALVAWNLRAAIGRAEIVVREQDLFGKYRLVRRIALGGMGEVLEAIYCPEGGFERRVAIKRIHADLAEQPRFVEDFRAEAQIGARLAHPNIVQVLDFGRVGETYFLAMEYVDGLSLSVLMRRLAAQQRRLPPHLAGTIAREILAGLAYAHESALGSDGRPLRVVHRDLCPQNILLSQNGEVKITDFGVARALKDSAVSRTQSVVGHLAYMAPEQALGQAVDPRSDLFPLGAMVWEMLTGRQLFRRDNEGASLMALLHDDPLPIRDLRDDVDAAWDRWIRRALARDQNNRFEDAREMAESLDAIPGSRAHDGVELATLVSEMVAFEEIIPEEAPTIVEPLVPTP